MQWLVSSILTMSFVYFIFYSMFTLSKYINFHAYTGFSETYEYSAENVKKFEIIDYWIENGIHVKAVMRLEGVIYIAIWRQIFPYTLWLISRF